MARTAVPACVLLLTCVITPASHTDAFSVEEREEIEKQLSFPKTASAKKLVVDNIFGKIAVSGHSGEKVLLRAHKTIFAVSKQAVAVAITEVTLDITEKSGKLSIVVDGPFRENCRYRRTADYVVRYDFELEVPYDTSLELSTVNDGAISIANVRGDFDIQNVNGPITLTEVAGSGRAHTVNGRVEARFKRVPRADCSFRTVNGDLNLFFPKRPNADFLLKTFNGAVYSDFPVSSITALPGKSQRRGGKYVYESSGFNRVRIGSGGPKIEVDGLNGDILIAAR